MTAEQWARLQSLFGEAISLSAPDRHIVLNRTKENEPELATPLEHLLNNYDSNASDLDRPLLTVNELVLQTGESISDRFTIDKLLGIGGMGEVYLAHDRELHERIAVKIIAAQRTPDETILQSFRHEVLLSRQISHPNVCRVFDIGKLRRAGKELLYLTMEYIEGQTLAELANTTAISVSDAKAILLEVLDGLEAAHRAGVLHRDLKPQNVMVRTHPLRSGHRAAITDFGLAHPVTPPANTGHTTGQAIVGTPLYMAPEQLEGQPASEQTDIYSFGLLAYELLAGNPTTETNPLAAIVKRARTQPTPIHTIVPAVGTTWSHALHQCLNPRPAERPKNIAAVRALLDGKRPMHVTFSDWITRREVMIAGITTATATAASTLIWSHQHARPVLHASPTMMLAPPDNATNDQVYDGLGIMLKEHLNQSTHLSVVQPNEFPDALRLMLKTPEDRLAPTDVRHLALRIQAPLVLFSTLNRIGSSFSILLLLEHLGTGSAFARRSWNKTFLAATRNELFTALHEGCLWVRQITGEPDNAIALNSRRPEEVTTDSWEALHDFSEGENNARANHRENALQWYASALRRDPQFAMAYMRTGDLLFSLGRESEGLRAWTTAIEAISRRPCSRREELATRGMFASDTSDFNASVTYYDELSRQYPKDHRGFRFRVLPLCYLNRRAEAVTVAEQYVTQAPETPSSWLQLAFATIFQGNSTRAETAIAHIKRMTPKSEGHALQFRLDYQQSRYQEAETEMRQAVRCAQEQGDTARHSEYERRLAHLLADKRQLQTACQLLNDSAQRDEAVGARSNQACKLLSLAYLSIEHEPHESIRRLCVNAMELDPSITCLRRAGQMLARLRFVKEAQSALAPPQHIPQRSLRHNRATTAARRTPMVA